jgi:hypothetical protein
MKYKTGDIVLVTSFAGPKVRVRLVERYTPRKNEWGSDGWDATIIYKKDIDKLRQSGVPYKKSGKPNVWVFDFEIIKLIRSSSAKSRR